MTVQALDYGFTTQVHYRNLCWLQPGIFPKKYNKQAIRCKLKGTLQQGSHSTWKNESTPGKPGNIMEF